MSRSGRHTLDYFDDLLMSSDDVTQSKQRQRHLRHGSESTVSSGGEPWEDVHYGKYRLQQQCQTSGLHHRRDPSFPTPTHRSYGNNPAQIEDDETCGSGSGSGSGSWSYRHHLGHTSDRSSMRSRRKQSRDTYGGRQGPGWGYSLASPEDCQRFNLREHRREMSWAQVETPKPFENPKSPLWSEESQGGEAGNTVESISLRNNKAYQYTPPTSPFIFSEESENQSNPRPDNKTYQQLNMDPISPEDYMTIQIAEAETCTSNEVAQREAAVLKDNELFEYGLMPRILPNSGDEQMQLFHMACLDSQPQSNCRTSLSLNSWVGESIDPTFTAESFGLSGKDDAPCTTVSIEFDVMDRNRRTPSCVGSIQSCGDQDIFGMSISEEKAIEAEAMDKFDMDMTNTNTARSDPAVLSQETTNDCAVSCRPKKSKKRVVKALRRFLCGRLPRQSLEQKWTDQDLKALGATQSTEGIRSSIDRGRGVESSSREDTDSSQDSQILDTPRGHRGERFSFPEANSSKKAVQIVVKQGDSSKSSVKLTEKIVWKEPQQSSFQLRDVEWAKYWRFNGYWTLDRELSDSQNVWQFVGPMGKAVDKIESLVIDSTPRACRTVLLSIGQKLQEQRPWGGEMVRCERRDRRLGSMMIWVERTHKGYISRMEWGDPYPAHLGESFELSKDGQLLFSIQEIQRRDKPEIRSRTRSVYRRQG